MISAPDAEKKISSNTCRIAFGKNVSLPCRVEFDVGGNGAPPFSVLRCTNDFPNAAASN